MRGRKTLIKYHSTLWLSCSARSRQFFCSKTFCCWIRLVTSSRHVGTISDIFAICYGNVARSFTLYAWECVCAWVKCCSKATERSLGEVATNKSTTWKMTGKSLWNWAILMTLNSCFEFHIRQTVWKGYVYFLSCVFLLHGGSSVHFENEEWWWHGEQRQQR